MRLRNGILLAILALCLGCFGDDDDGPAGPEAPVYSGTFAIADTLEANSCDLTAPLGAQVNVTVSGDAITFAGIDGAWDADELRGQGSSAPTTVPINPTEDCYGTYVASFDIVFDDEDHFHGRYEVGYSYTAGCGAPDCGYDYRIGGTRPLARTIPRPGR
jgi:hypothetical protein